MSNSLRCAHLHPVIQGRFPRTRPPDCSDTQSEPKSVWQNQRGVGPRPDASVRSPAITVEVVAHRYTVAFMALTTPATTESSSPRAETRGGAFRSTDNAVSRLRSTRREMRRDCFGPPSADTCNDRFQQSAVQNEAKSRRKTLDTKPLAYRNLTADIPYH